MDAGHAGCNGQGGSDGGCPAPHCQRLCPLGDADARFDGGGERAERTPPGGGRGSQRAATAERRTRGRGGGGAGAGGGGRGGRRATSAAPAAPRACATARAVDDDG